MVNACLFFKLLLFTNLFVSSSRINRNGSNLISANENSDTEITESNNIQASSKKRRRGYRDGSDIVPRPFISEFGDSSSRSLFNESCVNLNKEIRQFAINQLGIDDKFVFSDYTVTNWPTLVPTLYINWDKKALVELKEALPTMTFVKKPDCIKELGLTDFFKNERIKNRRADHWNCSEVLALYRNLENIKFEPVSPGKARTVTFTDGVVEKIVPKKFGLRADLDSEEDSNENEDIIPTVISTSSRQVCSSSKRSSSSSSNLEIGEKDLLDLYIMKDSTPKQDQQEISSSSSHAFGNSKSCNLHENDSTKSHFSFKETCWNLSNEIKAFAMKQLGLNGFRSQIKFQDYNITNWPIFVPIRYTNWDEQALVDLRSALPNMIFTINPDHGKDSLNSSEYFIQERLKNRRLIFNMLLQSYRKQTKKFDTQRITWNRYHLKGWPRNVKLRSSDWSCSEILTLFRNLENIKFVPILPGEKRTVTYSDGVMQIVQTSKRKLTSDSDLDENEMTEDNSFGTSSARYCNYITTGSSSGVILESDDLMDLGIINEDEEPFVFEDFNFGTMEKQYQEQQQGSSSASETLSPYSEIKDVEKFIEEELENYNPNRDNF